MPIYEYKCPVCGTITEEIILPRTGPVMVVCRKCSARLGRWVEREQIVSAPSIIRIK